MACAKCTARVGAPTWSPTTRMYFRTSDVRTAVPKHLAPISECTQAVRAVVAPGCAHATPTSPTSLQASYTLSGFGYRATMRRSITGMVVSDTGVFDQRRAPSQHNWLLTENSLATGYVEYATRWPCSISGIATRNSMKSNR